MRQLAIIGFEFQIIDYHDKSNAPSTENSASAFKYMWNTEIVNNPISGAIAVYHLNLAEVSSIPFADSYSLVQ